MINKVKVSKINSGLKVEILSGVRSVEARERLFYAAQDWFEAEVLKKNPEIERDFFSGPYSEKRNVRESSVKGIDKVAYFGYEPWGFCIEGHMNDTGSCPTGSRASTLEKYQSAFDSRIVGNGVYFEKYLTFESERGQYGTKFSIVDEGAIA